MSYHARRAVGYAVDAFLFGMCGYFFGPMLIDLLRFITTN